MQIPPPRSGELLMDGSGVTRERGQHQQLVDVLRARFGHSAFRPHQEAVCAAVVDGCDALLVMPTGAGKSLCYQLPGLVRAQAHGGVTLVVSPLIALMDDQVQKLRAQGLRAEAIHSGRDRSASRAACVAYLAGELDFLFFAPERLAVPGFPELLARKTPALVVIDEAHCISMWGHDFRPEYRMIGERIPKLRPAPVLALTATATQTVQDDIVERLQLGVSSGRAKRFIHGFRRTNLALEVVDSTPKDRVDLAYSVLEDAAARPAIVYAGTRKQAEEASEELHERGIVCATYHAGLPPETRERIQREFLAGDVDVVVATVAFGMGIDKSDVRTVMHLALPQSLEGYTQEVGRAGRDGKPARAILLSSFVDTRTHEFFWEQDYPEVAVLKRVYHALPAQGEIQRESLRKKLGMKTDELERVLDKMWVHAGVVARVDESGDDVVGRGSAAFTTSYEAQRKHKHSQIQTMLRFADGHGCRMEAILRHFGDDDGGGPCGLCDACDPSNSAVQKHRAPSTEEQAHVAAILEALRNGRSDGMALGRLFKDSVERRGVDRRSFQHLLGALMRSGIVRTEMAAFDNDDGERVQYERVRLVEDRSPAEVMVRVTREKSGGKKRKSKRPTARAVDDDDAPQASPALVHKLQEWRRLVASSKRVPAFRVMGNDVLVRLAAASPSNDEELLQVKGIGPRFVKDYGAAVVALLTSSP